MHANTHTHKETHAQSRPSCRHSDLAVTHRLWLHSSVLLPLHSSLLHLLLFTKQHRTLLSPEEKEQNLQEEHRGSVVLLCTGEQHPFDWKPKVRAWLPKPAGFFGVCVSLCVWMRASVCACMRLCSLNVCVGICMCVSLGGCVKFCLLMLRESHKLFLSQKTRSHMTEQHVRLSFFYTL